MVLWNSIYVLEFVQLEGKDYCWALINSGLQPGDVHSQVLCILCAGVKALVAQGQFSRAKSQVCL